MRAVLALVILNYAWSYSWLLEKPIKKALMITLVPFAVLFKGPDAAFADEGLRTVGEFQTSGLVFKDTLRINSVEDPKVHGVKLYFSEFERPINEKLSGDMFNDPSSTSLSCSVDKEAKVGDISTSPQGEEVFEESRNLFFKQTRIRRIYDKEANNIVYVSYSTRLDKSNDSNKSRFKSSTCVVHMP